MPRKHTYGPFRSRRLGLSLGIDILSREKTCTFDCVYCEIGRTKNLVSPCHIVKNPPDLSFRKELKDILKYFPNLDSLTFGYNGEPTLNNHLLDYLEIAQEVRDSFNWLQKKPLLTLFTNSSTLFLDEIRKKVRAFDLVVAKLDAADELDYKRTNRPHEECPDILSLIESLRQLRIEMSKNKLALQCLIYDSYVKEQIANNNSENIINLAKIVKQIEPDVVQIYSIARIPAEYFVYSIADDRKKEIVRIFKETIQSDKIEISYF
jgi:wyosine [tRNA(Phe)-imidazoG37] synthetase (radical SAM superfamily)